MGELLSKMGYPNFWRAEGNGLQTVAQVSMAKYFFFLDNEKMTARVLFVSLSVLFILLVCARQISNSGHLVASDGVGYFAHLPSILIDGDLDYTDDFAVFGKRGRNHWPIGTAVAWLPFYLVGHLVSLTGAALGSGWSTDGTGFPEQLACCIGTIVYGIGAITLCFRICCRWFQPRLALLGVLLLFGASNLPYYLLAEPYMSHGVAVFWVSALLYLGLGPDPLTPKRAALVGVIAGLAALTRQQDGLFVILPFLYHLPPGPPATTLVQSSRQAWTRLALALVVTGVVSFLTFSPQLALWQQGLKREMADPGQIRVAKRVPVLKSKIIPGGRLNWLRPNIVKELFGRRYGLFIWHPAYLLAFGGLLGLLFQRKRIATVALCGILLQVYLMGVWGGQGQTFGARMFISCFGLFAFGMVSLLQDWSSQLRRLTVGSGIILGAWNLFLMFRFRQLFNSGTRTRWSDILDIS
jgi:hypothetical protein